MPDNNPIQETDAAVAAAEEILDAPATEELESSEEPREEDEPKEPQRVRMSYDEFFKWSALITESPGIEPCGQCPTIEEIKKFIEPDMVANLDRALWIEETVKLSRDPEKRKREKAVLKYLKDRIDETLELYEEESSGDSKKN